MKTIKPDYITPDLRLLGVKCECVINNLSVPIDEDLEEDTDKTQRYEEWSADDWSFEWEDE